MLCARLGSHGLNVQHVPWAHLNTRSTGGGAAWEAVKSLGHGIKERP